MAPKQSSRGIRAEHLLGTLIRRSTPWAGAIGALCVVVYLILDGLGAALAAALGVGLVIFFFGLDTLILRMTRRATPGFTVGVLLVNYPVKVVLIALLLWTISTSSDFDLHATAVTVVITTVAGAIAVTVAALRVRTFYFDFPDAGDGQSRNSEVR
jgi:hypothetical protein